MIHDYDISRMINDLQKKLYIGPWTININLVDNYHMLNKKGDKDIAVYSDKDMYKELLDIYINVQHESNSKPIRSGFKGWFYYIVKEFIMINLTMLSTEDATEFVGNRFTKAIVEILTEDYIESFKIADDTTNLNEVESNG